MIVQTYFPQKLSRLRYDAYLASGWFRGSIMLYKMDLLCLEKDVFSVVNIRLKLPEFEYRSSHKKLLRRNKKKFTFKIEKARVDLPKELLYAKQKERFKGFIHGSLYDYLYQGHPYTPFDTWEITVYDGDRLVAASMFDRGERAIASLIGIQDPDYEKYSLGIFTMLLEIEHARDESLRWYYPGYVLDKPSSFNYKLSLGNFEYYNHNKRWVSYDKFVRSNSLAEKFKKKLSRIEDCLRHNCIEYDSWLYPYFSMGYMKFWSTEFVKSAKFLEIPTGTPERLLITYNIEEDTYELWWTRKSSSQEQLLTMELSNEFKNDSVYCLTLLENLKRVSSSRQPQDIAFKVQEITSTGASSERNHLS